MKFSIVIPAFNEERYLTATLAALKCELAALENESETIVVDNESTDRTREIALEYDARVVSETTHNIAAVRNAGAKNARGDVLIFIDADTIAPEGLLRQIADAMVNERCYGGAVAVGYGDFKRRWMRFYLRGWELWSRFFNMKQGAAQFCRAAQFSELGGYDESFFMGEDVEFYWRLSKLARGRGGFLDFIENPKVLTSSRRFDQMSVWKTLVLTNPLFFLLTMKKKRFWRDWYDKPVR